MGTRDDIKASEDELVAARQSTAKMGPIYGLLGVFVVGLIAPPAAFIAAQLASGWWGYLLTAVFVAVFFAPAVVVMVRSSLVMAARGEDAMATLEHRLRHMTRMATSSPTGESPNCEVDSPDQCPAARRAQVQRFTDSEALDACPKLRGRAQGACAAVCVPRVSLSLLADT